MISFYQMEAFESIPDASGFLAKAAQILADVSPPCSAGNLPRVSIWNLPTVGPKFSLSTKQMQAAIATDLSEHPRFSVHIVIMPNTPKFGEAFCGHGYVLQTGIQNFKDEIASSLRDTPEALVYPCTAMYDEDSMYSPSRDLRVEFLLVMSGTLSGATGASALRSIWAKSALFKRRALPKLVEPMPRSSFKDWSTKNCLFDRGNLCESAELRQWHSGVSLYSGILNALGKGMGFTKDQRVLVKDMTLYDDTLCMAISQLNSSKALTVPVFGYAGASWGTPDKARTRAQTVAEAVLDQMVTRVKVDPGVIPHFRLAPAGPAPIFNSSQKPQFSEDNYKITCPRANGELPIRQVCYDKWSDKGLTTPSLKADTPGLTWGNIVETHNKEFNPTGVPFKAKRLADLPLEALAAANPDPMVLAAPGKDEPQDVDEFKSAKGVVVDSGHAMFDYLVTAPGGLYLVGKEDGVLPTTEPLFVVRGDAKQGPAAAKTMKDSQSWLQYLLGPETLVAVSVLSPIQVEIPAAPTPLKEILGMLEQGGYVKVQLYLHTVTRDPSSPAVYAITQNEAEVACLEVKVQENLHQVADLSSAKLASYVDINTLKQCPLVTIVDRLQFNPGLNKLMSGFPAVFPVKPIKIYKGKLGKLF